jgi:hypothetical protein
MRPTQTNPPFEAASRTVSRPIAFVLLEAAATPDMPLLVEAMRRRHAELPWEIQQSEQGGALPFIRCGGTLVVVMQVGAALPHDANLWRRAAMTWPAAPRVAESHRAHLIVSVMGEATNKLESARIVTAVIGGLIATVPGSCAVVWEVRVARSAQMWLEASRTAFAPYPHYPFTLWIDIMPFRSNPSSVMTSRKIVHVLAQAIAIRTAAEGSSAYFGCKLPRPASLRRSCDPARQVGARQCARPRSTSRHCFQQPETHLPLPSNSMVRSLIAR